MPIFRNRFSVRNSWRPLPVFLRTMAPSMVEPVELYMKVVPGSWFTGICMKSWIQCSELRGISSMPQPMHSTSRTVSFFRFSLGFSGDSSGKMSMSRSSSFRMPWV